MASILQYIQRFIALHFLAKCCNSKNAVKFMIAKVDHFGRQKLKCISMLFKCMVLEFTNGASFQNFRTSFSKMIVRDFSFSVSEAIMYIHIKILFQNTKFELLYSVLPLFRILLPRQVRQSHYLYISRAVSNYGTENEIWAGFEPVGNTKKMGTIMSNF